MQHGRPHQQFLVPTVRVWSARHTPYPTPPYLCYWDGGEIMELIAELITQQLFPIAMCLILCYYINTTTKEYTNAIENNTKAIAELTTLVSSYHEKG